VIDPKSEKGFSAQQVLYSISRNDTVRRITNAAALLQIENRPLKGPSPDE